MNKNKLEIRSGFGGAISPNRVANSGIISLDPYIAEFWIKGKWTRMPVDEFNAIWSLETKQMRLNLEPHGTFKILYL